MKALLYFAVGFGLGVGAVHAARPAAEVTEGSIDVFAPAPLLKLGVDANGNILSMIPAEAVLFDMETRPDGLSPRCTHSAIHAPDGAVVLVCLETDELARFLYPK